MSAALSRVAQALAGFLVEHSASDIGRRLGHHSSTVSRRGDELRHWSADEVLILAQDSPELAQSIQAAVTRTPDRPGDAAAATSDALALVERLGSQVSELVAAVRDGHIDGTEARALIGHLCQIETQSEMLRGHLTMIAFGVRKS